MSVSPLRGWGKPRWYHVGDRVTWKGYLLHCGIDHYAGGDAVDPWDPGWGWNARKRSRLWSVVLPSVSVTPTQYTEGDT